LKLSNGKSAAAYVKATLPNAEPKNIAGFATRNDALKWLRYDSATWLQVRRRALEKKEATN
jgi:hypothetical protein